MRKRRLLFLIIPAILSLQLSVGCQERPRRAASDRYAPGEIIVTFKEEAFNDKGEIISLSINALNDRFGLVKMEHLAGYTYVLKYSSDIDVVRVMKEYKKNPFVVNTEPNYIISAAEKE